MFLVLVVVVLVAVGGLALLLLGWVDLVTGGLIDAFPGSVQFGAWFAVTAGGCYAIYSVYQRLRRGGDAAPGGVWVEGVEAGDDGASGGDGGDGWDDAGPSPSDRWGAVDDDRERSSTGSRGHESASGDSGSGSGSGSGDSASSDSGGSSSGSND